MDKVAIKTFAVESRRKLMEDVEYRMSLVGVTKEGISDSISSADGIETYSIGGSATYSIYDEDIKKRASLVREIQNKGFENVVEEVAYTWFNRIIAIRFMEVNNYLPTKTRVLSSETPGKIEPDIITNALELDLDSSNEDKELIFKLKDKNKLDELFRFLFIKQCNKLNDILPGLFEKTDDYAELLLNISFTNEEGIVRKLINSISEEDFGEQVEIIGWIYQYYNFELKDETFADLKKKIKISKERIPAATQLFTPDWIVKYMVENSVGRIWLESHPNEELKLKWKYYVEDAEQDSEVELKLAEIRNKSHINTPEDIKVIDPCMGSGHILVYVFDVLMDIYVSEGYTEKDAAISILENNIFGLDIDDRAYQLSYFAVMMKARKYNRKIFNSNISPLLCSIQESNEFDERLLKYINQGYPKLSKDLNYLIKTFKDAKLYGSILNIDEVNFDELINLAEEIKNQNFSIMDDFTFRKNLRLIKSLAFSGKLLNQKYDVVVTNPPYMGSRSMQKDLINYLRKNYSNSKNDLSMVFMEKSINLSNSNGFIAIINIPVWMFISSYEKLRIKLLNNTRLINMIHLGRGIFGSDFGTTSFVINKNFINNFKGIYRQLYNDKGAVDSISQKEKWFFKDSKCFNKFEIKQSSFSNIPGSPIAYWADKQVFDAFEKGISINNLSDFTGSQNITANNNKYLRFFWEINSLKTDKWVSYAKGGEFRKYFGNLMLVVDWSDDAKKFYKNNSTSNLLDQKYWFKEGITYTAISSKGTGFRYLPKGCIFDKGGPSLIDVNNIEYCIGFLNSSLTDYFLKLLNPTLNIQVKDVKSLPIIFNEEYEPRIKRYVHENIRICKNDWDDYETSWNFETHPLIKFKDNTIENSFNKWSEHKQKDFNKLKSNEIELNKIFSDIYEIDIDSNVEDKDVSVVKADYEKDIKSYISYAIGCMFGRYSLDYGGLHFAGGNFNINDYTTFIPDDDNIIPVLDTEYFEDDIVGYFIDFIKKTFGEETLEENLEYIGNALSTSKKSSRDKIRDYLLKNFYKDHLKTYQKRPIYWMFSSGKHNGFNCLVYMPRYTPDLVARVRTDYLHKTQKAIEQNIVRCDNIINNSSVATEIKKATKEKNKLEKQLQETREYDEALAHIANKNIEIDLDDGVKVNYAKFQNVEVSKEGQKTKKINLLKKI